MRFSGTTVPMTEEAEGTQDDDGGSDDDDERLEQVGETIKDARQTAEDANVLVDPEERRFSESGDEGEDDQTAAPG